MQHLVQESIFPNLELCSEIELYFRTSILSRYDFENSLLSIAKNGKIKTDTYFNSLSIGKWKRHTNISDISFSMKFKGNIKITWILHRLHFSSRILGENYLNSKSIENISIPINFWEKLEDGILSFEVEALDDSEIYHFAYFTSSVPKNETRLGIVITHFNRQQYVLPAIERIKRELLSDKHFKHKVALYIVDNSQNLPKIEGVNIISNQNLGGSGGFTRGLMHLREETDSTHCLFMDDDASCEVSGIKRAISLLEYANDPELAIGGAMLREIEMFRQFECGARFDGLCRPNKSGVDLRNIHELLMNEIEEHIDYAGWWFFAFPLSKVKHYAFPYFVRGDDIGFGLVHKFNIITLNGISSWQDDFSLKNGPLPYYLDTRNHIMQNLHGFLDTGLLGIVKTTARMVLKNLLTYHYETGLASILALEDVLKGNDFWHENIDMMTKRQELLEITSNEKVVDIPTNISTMSILPNPDEHKLRKLFRWATLNGHILPQFCLKDSMILQNKGFGGSLREIFRYKKVLYLHHPSNKGFILEYNRTQFFNYLFRYIRAIYKLSVNYNNLKQEYRSSYEEFTSEQFWKKQFNKI